MDAYTAIAMEAIEDLVSKIMISNSDTGLVMGSGGPSTSNLLNSFDIS